MDKLKKEIVRKLASVFSEDELVPTKQGNQESMSFKSNEGEDAFDTLKRIFGIRESARSLFDAVVGNAQSKILTRHSSALLAFLYFNDVANHPIEIDGTVYDEVMFEVKNGVITASNPSNVDVLLMGENRKKLLFLESKFTEYLSGGNVTLSPHRYEEFYSMLTKKFDCPFSAGCVTVNSKTDEPQKTQYALYRGKKTSEYLEGIKQAFSHLLGIATGPAKKQKKGNEDYTSSLLDNADEIKFASIVFNCDNGRLGDYYNLYESVFKNSDAIKEAIRKVVNKRERNVIIVPELLQYQEVFRDYDLPDKVREFYRTVCAGIYKPVK